jgi:hypothetical protein
VGLTTPPCKTIIVTKPYIKEGRPKPTPGCSAEEEEEDKGTNLPYFTTCYIVSLNENIPSIFSKLPLYRVSVRLLFGFGTMPFN